MSIPSRLFGFLCLAGLLPAAFAADEADRIRLPHDPALSPDGARIAFSWRGDLWECAREGGDARRLTWHPAQDAKPLYSPDGKHIAFASNRVAGTWQVHVMNLAGGAPRQVTRHSEGGVPLDWFPGGGEILFTGVRDEGLGRRTAARLYRIALAPKSPERLLFDAYVSNFGARVSPDGTKVAFTREGEKWWRKEYRGALAAQVWVYDIPTGGFTCLARHPGGNRWPSWKPDGSSVYYAAQRHGAFNLYEQPLAGGEPVQLTSFAEDGVQYPRLSHDGTRFVYRRLFDLEVYSLFEDLPPSPLRIYARGDNRVDPIFNRLYQRADSASFTGDGKQMAFTAGGGVWVMDRELKEPVRVTPEGFGPAGQVCFKPDGSVLLFTSVEGGEWDIWAAHRADTKKWWWRNTAFKLTRLTQDAATEGALQFGPKGERVAFIKGLGDLWIMGADGKQARKVLDSWSAPAYCWSPDGKWMALSMADADMGYAVNVWLLSLKPGSKPINISMHPNDDRGPVWSPDGRKLAWVGRRRDNEPDICWVNLQLKDEEKDSRDAKLEKAIKAMGKPKAKKPTPGRKTGKGKKVTPAKATPTGAAKTAKPAQDPGAKAPAKPAKEFTSKLNNKIGKKPAKKPVPKAKPLVVDLENIHHRVKRVSLDGMEYRLFWGPKSEKLFFNLRGGGGSGLYAVTLGGRRSSPKKVGGTVGSNPVWLAKAKRYAHLSGGKPSLLGLTGRSTSYSFTVNQREDLRQRMTLAFDQAWRTMRDRYYDPKVNNRDWDAIRVKYGSAAPTCYGKREFNTLVNLMLGELNGSHLGFSLMWNGHPAFKQARPDTTTWRPTTWHLGALWDRSHAGPGLKVGGVVPRSPAAKAKSRLRPGDLVLAVDGRPVPAGAALPELFNRPDRRPIALKVKDAKGKQRTVEILPVTYGAVRRLRFDELLEERRERVDALSKGRIGYLLVEAMSMGSFYKFQAELYSAGYGKDGLLIDVRDNGGGSTADRLLTALCQPRHAITLPRGGAAGYPRDRIVYARWNKPIVVLCNQRSYSNAEIFSHAVKTLGRGKVVGVPTAGGVISTGGASIYDMGFMRLPMRAWFLLNDGRDMERNGAVPHHVIWPVPSEDVDVSKDRQMAKAVEVLLADIAAAKARPKPRLRYASEKSRGL